MIHFLKYLALATVLLWSPVNAGVIVGGSGSGIGAGGAHTPPVPYLAVAVDFDGTDYLTRGGGLTGVADGKQGMFSVWFRLDGTDGNRRRFWYANGGFYKVKIEPSNKLQAHFFNSSASPVLFMETTGSYTAGASWYHVLIAWDLSVPVAYLYVDDVNVEAGGSTEINDAINYDRSNFGVGASDAGTDTMNGCFADFYFALEFLDISVESNRRKFIDGAGKPVDLSSDGSTPTGTAPIVFFSGGDETDWMTNDGTGGGFTDQGSIALCSTSPSD